MKNWFYFPSLVLALLLGVFLGTKTCKGTKVDSTVTVLHDSIYIREFVPSTPTVETVVKYKDRIEYKDKLITQTVDKVVYRPEYINREILKDRLVYATSTKDSLNEVMAALDSLGKVVDSLNTYSTYKKTVKTKNTVLDYAIFGRSLDKAEFNIKVRNRVEITPSIGIAYQTNGKSYKDFTYRPYIGFGINYNQFTLNGGLVWNTTSNDLNSWIFGFGYKLKL